MTDLHDPLTLPTGLVLLNRIMKASMSWQALAESRATPRRPARAASPHLESWRVRLADLRQTSWSMVPNSGEPGNVVIEDERDLDALTRVNRARRRGADLGPAQSPWRQSNPLAIGHTPVASAVLLNPPA